MVILMSKAVASCLTACLRKRPGTKWRFSDAGGQVWAIRRVSNRNVRAAAAVRNHKSGMDVYYDLLILN